MLFSFLMAGGLVIADKGTAESLTASFRIMDVADQERTQFATDQPLIFELTIKNKENFTVNYWATGPGYDIKVKQNDNTVWSNFHGVAFPQMIEERLIEPFGAIKFRVHWSATDNDEVKVAPGYYMVTPELVIYINDKKVKVPKAQKILLYDNRTDP